MDLFNFIGEKDYRTFAGGSWPTFSDFQIGKKAQNPEIQQEIDSFVEMMQQTYQDLNPDPDHLAVANQHRQGQQFFDKKYIANGCRIPWTTLGINANGNAFICSSPSWVPKFVGNIVSDADIWAVLNSETAQRIRQEIYHGRYYYCNNQLCNFFGQVPTNKYQNIVTTSDDPLPYESRAEYQVHEIPSQLIFDFDYTCNFRCPSCRTETINNNKHRVIRSMNDSIVQQIKTEIIDRIGKQPVNIRWAGGEPFISEPYLELFEYINSVNKPNITHTIQTNGSYLKNKKELLAKLLPSVQELRVSFDAATADTYALTRVGGVWTNLIDNVQWVKEFISANKLNTVLSADFVVQKLNYQEIPAFKQLCKDLGITNIKYQKMWNWGTWTQGEFHSHNVYNRDHNEYPKLIEIFRSVGKNIVE
jgi:molybdenum cofactor biosynthesis enzyme MoaA